MNSRHARSGEIKCRLYCSQNLGKSDYQLMQPRTLTILKLHWTASMLNTFAQINGHLNPFVNSNYCNFTLMKQCYASGVFCWLPNARPTDEGTSLAYTLQEMIRLNFMSQKLLRTLYQTTAPFLLDIIEVQCILFFYGKVGRDFKLTFCMGLARFKVMVLDCYL